MNFHDLRHKLEWKIFSFAFYPFNAQSLAVFVRGQLYFLGQGGVESRVENTYTYCGNFHSFFYFSFFFACQE